MPRLALARAILAAGLAAVLLPTVASAQSAITGVVRDTSDAVLPGARVPQRELDGGRSDPGVDFDSEHDRFHRGRVDPGQRPHSQDGDQVRK